MCGIVGYMGTNIEESVLKNMMEQIRHRGPDGEGMYLDDQIGLGHRRLAIIDIDGGRQPMKNEDGNLICVFNGEVYNHQELREELKSRNHTFSTESDTEVLLHGYEEWKYELPEKLQGMFAFVIWDRAKKELFCARDCFGIKPFYYYKRDDVFLFGSEIKSFLVHPEFEKKMNLEQLELYLTYQYSPGTGTFFENVWKLPPAHYMVVKQEKEIKTELHEYWKPEFKDDKYKTLEEWAIQIDRVMRQSVRDHEISDVEVGSFLSSGVDSSYVVSLSHVNKTFTIGFENLKYDESSLAHSYSQELGIWNQVYAIDAEELFETLPRIQYYMDEPLGDAASIALYFLNRKAAKHVKVCLSGEGADELFAGYHIYKEPEMCKKYDGIPLWMRSFIGAVADMLPDRAGIRFLVRHGRNLSQRYIGNTSLFTEKQKRRLMKQYIGNKKPEVLSQKYFEELDNADEVTRMQYVDLHLWLPGDILLKADKMSMAHSVELRVPFLDKEVFAIASQIPTNYKVNQNETKIALRMAAKRRIGSNIAGRKKLGFPVPIREWLREDKYAGLVRKSFESESAKKFFQTRRLVKLLDDHISGKRDNFRQIWCVYMFLVWHEVYFGECRGEM